MHLPRLLLAALLLSPLGCAHDTVNKEAATKSPASAPATTRAAAPFAKEIEAFEAIDRSPARPAPGGVVFYGSSSIRFWKSLATDFPGVPVVNRGFGGSRMDQCVMYLDRAVVGLKPSVIVVYAGDNDLAGGHSVERVVADTRQFMDDVHKKLPGTKIIFLAIKPSPSRAHLLDKYKAANAQIAAMAGEKHFTFVDVATPMLGEDGQPRGELFREDRLHMNEKGYALWTQILTPYIELWTPSRHG